MAFKKFSPRRVQAYWGNISKVEFADTWPNGRKFKHGAMKIHFQFQPQSRLAAIDEVEMFMSSKGYVRSEDYHIPGWNFNGYNYVRNDFFITFDSDEKFVMAKLSWQDTEDEESSDYY